MPTALIVAGGGFQGLPVLRSLHALGWRVVIADSIPNSVNRFECEHFAVVPPVADAAAFQQTILELVRKYRVKAVFGTTAFDLPYLARLRTDIEALGARVFVSTPDLLALVENKARCNAAARRAGIPVLPDEDPARHDYRYPLIAKPVGGWGGRGVEHISSVKEAERLPAHEPGAYVWQRALADFTEWSVDFAIDSSGVYSPIVTRRRLRVSGGFAVLCEILQAPDVEVMAEDVARWLAESGGCGLFNIQILQEHGAQKNKHDPLWLSDVNARPGTSSVCAELAGENLVGFLLGKAPTTGIRHGIVVRSLWDRFLPHIETPIEGVVFDLDETLLCQKSWMRAKMGLMLEALSETLAPEELRGFRSALASGIDEGPWDRLLDVAVTRAGVRSLAVERLIELWRAATPQSAVLFPDAVALIASLREKGIPVALVSDNPVASQKMKLSLLPEKLRFDATILTDEISAPKPSPAGFVLAAERLSIAPERLVMIGDSPWRDGVGALAACYAACLIVRRQGVMSNPQKAAFEDSEPEAAGRMVWLDTLYGAEQILFPAARTPCL